MSVVGSQAHSVKPKQRFTVDRVCEIGACVEMTGGKLGAAILLFRVHQRYRGKGIHRFNKKWIALTRNQMRRELGGEKNFSLDRYNDALATLKKLELVECMHASVNGRQQEITHLRLTDKAVVGLAKAHPSENSDTSPNPPSDHMSENSHTSPGHLSENSYTCGSHLSENSDTYTKEADKNLENKNLQKEEAAAAQTAHPGKGFSGKVQEGGKTGKQAVPGSCSTPAALPVLVPHAAPLVKIGTSTPLPEVWQAIGEFFIGQTNDHAKADVRNGWVQAQLLRGTLPTEWGAKEWGHAKTLRESWQNHRSALVAFVCILRWEQFHHYCQKRAAKADHWKLSGTPDLQCLVHFKTQAAEFMQRHLADMQAEMAEAEAKAAEEAAEANAKAEYEATLITYRSEWFTKEGKYYWDAPNAPDDERKYAKARCDVRHCLNSSHSKETQEVLGIGCDTPDLQRYRMIDAMIDEIASAADAGMPLDALEAKYKLGFHLRNAIIKNFSGKEWAKRIRDADQQKIAA